MRPRLERLEQEAARLRAALARLERENALHKPIPNDYFGVRRGVDRWIVVRRADGSRYHALARELAAVEASLATARHAVGGRQLVVLIGCVATKRPPQPDAGGRPQRWPAADLYVSPLFRRRRTYAERRAPRAWAIISAQAGLLLPHDLIAPYDLALSQLSPAELRDWARLVAHRVRDFGPPQLLQVEIHAGELYCRDLAVLLRRAGAQVLLPVHGMSLLRQLRWYRDQEHGHDHDPDGHAR